MYWGCRDRGSFFHAETDPGQTVSPKGSDGQKKRESGMNFPDEFKVKMKDLLAEEYEFFEASYEKPRRRGLRVNEYKVSAEEFAERAPFPLERIPWVKNGFFYGDDVRPARHPYYAAGLYYLQEPSAMTPASRLPLDAGFDKKHILGFMTAPWQFTTEENLYTLMDDAYRLGLCRKWYGGSYE